MSHTGIMGKFSIEYDYMCIYVCACVLSHVRLFAARGTVNCQTPPSVEFSRQEYRSGLPFSLPHYLSASGMEPGFPALQADSLPSEPWF